TIDEATKIASELQNAMNEPMNLVGQEVFVSACIGIASLVAGYAQAEDVLADAAYAMERSKSGGRGQILPYRREMRSHSSGEWMLLESELRHAVERDQFHIFYQPIIDLRSNQIIGFEGLLRWDRPEQGIVSPGLFIPLAEEIGEIIPIGEWLLNEGCRQLAEWNARPQQTSNPLFLSLNVSRRQIDEPLLINHVEAELLHSGIDPKTLKLEVTESLVMERPEEMSRVLTNLQAMNVKLAIDDFGTGYSSLERLHAMPFDTLKIDRSFVTNILVDQRRATIVRSVVEMAHALGCDVVAEGVETKTDVDMLIRAGCDLAQGFFYGRPVPAPEAERLLKLSTRPQLTVAN
ncbi:MAG: EAL domain-containing protein, partial [Okeania sp. SIO3C4]|nr:EAL domain-containing protein [Okeania sp. SIO3C4]